MNKLGYHVNVLTSKATGTIRAQRNGALIKWLTSGINLGEMERWKEQNPNGLQIVRHVIEFNSSMTPQQRTEELLKHIVGYEHVIDCLETPFNEEMQTIASGLAGIGGIDRYADMTNIATDMIKQRYPDIKVAVGHFSVGNPPDMRNDWDAYAPALATADYLSLHEYGSPFVWSEPDDPNNHRRHMMGEDYPGGWWCLRYRQVYQYLKERGYPTPPLILSEIGRDHGLTIDTNYGWKYDVGHGGGDIDRYVSELRWLAYEMARDLYVVGGTIFSCGVYPDWETFDVAGQGAIENLLSEDISAPAHPSSILGPHQAASRSDWFATPAPAPRSSIIIEGVEVPESARGSQWHEWATHPENRNPKTGPGGLAAFLAHMRAVGTPTHRVLEAGFPHFDGMVIPGVAPTSPPPRTPTPAPQADPPASLEERRRQRMGFTRRWDNKKPQPAPQPAPEPQQERLGDMFARSDSPQNQTDASTMAGVLQCSVGMIKSVMDIESGGNAFLNGRMVVRLEPHVLLGRSPHTELVQNTFQGTNSWRPSGHKVLISNQWLPVHGSQENEYRAIEIAERIDAEATYQSMSMGWAQIMGFHFDRLGYDNARQMFRGFSAAKVVQDWGFVSFILSDVALLRALRAKDSYTFAKIYNGPGQAEHYANLINERLKIYGEL